MGRPIASAPEPTDAEGQRVSRLRHIPEDPATPLLTVEGAPLLDAGKIDLSAYESLGRYFAREPLAEAHPDPARPGVRGDETVPKGLRLWDDVKALREGQNGAGWIAAYSSRREPKKEKWFNIQSCGSWRLAFLLARLQLRVWQRGYHGATEATAVSARRITRKRPVEDWEIQVKEPTFEAVEQEAPPRTAPKPLMESSARMQQLLERVRARAAGSQVLEPASPKKPLEPREEALSSKVRELLLAAAEEPREEPAAAGSPSPRRREVREEPRSGEKLKQPRLA